MLLGNNKDRTVICVDEVLDAGPTDEEWWLNHLLMYPQRPSHRLDQDIVDNFHSVCARSRRRISP